MEHFQTTRSSYSTSLFFAGMRTHRVLAAWWRSSTLVYPSTPIRDAIVASSEASSFVDPIIRLYEVAFGRQADEAGLTNWVNTFRNGTSFETIALVFTGSPEFINRFGTSTDRPPFL